MNPAERLLNIYDKLVAVTPDEPMLKTWCGVLGIDPLTPRLEDVVTANLVALRSEVDLARTLLDSLGAPPDLTSPGFERLKQVAFPGNLNQSWNNMRGNVQPPECRHAFKWSAWVLREVGEADMASDELKELREGVGSLESMLEQSDLSPYLREFIERQLETIRAALGLYSIQGVRPLKEALRKVAGDFTVEADSLSAAAAVAPTEAKSLFAKATELINKTAIVCDSVEKIGKAGSQAMGLAGKIRPMIEPFLQTALDTMS